MVIEIFITNGDPLTSTCTKGDITTLLDDLSAGELSSLVDTITAMIEKDSSNCGYLVDNPNIAEPIRFDLKHSSVSADSVFCDKGAIIEDSEIAVYTPLISLTSSVDARI